MKNLEQLNNDAPILKHTIDLYKELYIHLKTFPKKDQYVLGKQIEEHVLVFLELILRAAGMRKARKLEVLEQANGKFEVFKVLLYLAREMKMLDNKKYLSAEAKAQEIGMQLGGWLRSLR
jgi:four helix bundle protein